MKRKPPHRQLELLALCQAFGTRQAAARVVRQRKAELDTLEQEKTVIEDVSRS